MSRSLLSALLLLSALTGSLTEASSQCKASQTYTCPANCPENATREVTDCFSCEGYFSTDTLHNMCIDRRLFQPRNTDEEDFDDHYHYLWNDLVGFFVWFFTAFIAISCGVGGGGIYVPLGILLFQFAPKQSSGLSQASIFGASLAGMLLNLPALHPNQKIRHDAGVKDIDPIKGVEKNRYVQKELTPAQTRAYEQAGGIYYTRPLVDLDMALFLSPMVMAGAVLGVLIQKILPNWLYLLISGLVLSFTSYKTYKKFFAVRAKETADMRKTQTAVEVEDEENSDVEDKISPGADPENTKSATENAEDTDASEASETQEMLELRKEFLRKDMKQIPREKFAALGLLWMILILLTLLKGGKGLDSLVGIDCESPWYFVLIACQFLWMFAFATWFGFKLMKDQAARLAVHYPYLLDDPLWDMESLRFYGSFTFVAGIVAGLIGIGGGMVLGPLMIVMGIHPRVSSATNATMVVLTSSSVAVTYVTSGLVPWSYALFAFFVCFCGAYVGKATIDGYVKRTGRASLLVFLLASIIAFATVGCFVILLTRLADNDWCFESFNKFCDISDSTTGAACTIDRFLESTNLFKYP